MIDVIFRNGQKRGVAKSASVQVREAAGTSASASKGQGRFAPGSWGSQTRGP